MKRAAINRGIRIGSMRGWRIIALTATTCMAFAGQHAEMKKLQALYDRACFLTMKRDEKGLVQFLRSTRTADYQFVSSKGEKHTLAQLIGAMNRVISDFEVTRSTVRIDRLVPSGANLSATITTRVDMVSRAAPDRRRHTLTEIVQGQDLWVSTGGGWKLKHSKVVTETLTQDGKPLIGPPSSGKRPQ